MAQYTVTEVYTPHDTDLDRKRCEAKFESESTDLFELAVQARIACYNSPVDDETVVNVRHVLEQSEVLEQLADTIGIHHFFDRDGTSSTFAFEVFGHNGDWELTVTRHIDE